MSCIRVGAGRRVVSLLRGRGRAVCLVRPRLCSGHGRAVWRIRRSTIRRGITRWLWPPCINCVRLRLRSLCCSRHITLHRISRRCSIACFAATLLRHRSCRSLLVDPSQSCCLLRRTSQQLRRRLLVSSRMREQTTRQALERWPRQTVFKSFGKYVRIAKW